MYGERLRGDTVGVWMRASTATRCPLALNNIAAATNLETAGGVLDHRRRAPGQRGRDPLTAAIGEEYLHLRLAAAARHCARVVPLLCYRPYTSGGSPK